MVIWLIGLAGAGKTSIGRELYRLIRRRDPATVFLDGDQVRAIVGDNIGYTVEERRANGWRMCRFCKYLDDQNLNVVCATLSQFHDQQRWNRESYSRYFEVYLDVGMDVLIKRDQKGIYSGALAGSVKNVVGVDMPFPAPLAPDLVIENNNFVRDLAPLAEQVLAAVDARHSDWKLRA